MPSFNFFKKRDKDISKLSSKKSGAGAGTSNSTIPIVQAQDNKITIEDAIKELEKSEGRISKNLLTNLEKTFEDTNLAFQRINIIAEELDAEVIDTEEEKLMPLVQNTKNTIVRALKRESSNILPIPKTFEDFIKYKDSVDASINRFGEVTSSHSRIVNTFMKKHANSLRGELKRISDSSEKLNDEYEQITDERKMIEQCRSNLLGMHSKIDEINRTNIAIKNLDQKIRQLQEGKDRREKEINSIKSSSDYSKCLKYLQEKEEIDKRRKKSINELYEISSHLTKAANKYSYGLSRGTVEKIDTIVNKPSEIVSKTNMSEYITLLKDIKESVRSNKIVLKDSKKVLQYFDMLMDELPKFKSEIKELDSRVDRLKDKDKIAVLDELKRKEAERKEAERMIMSENQRKDETSKQKTELEEQMISTTKDIEEQIHKLCRKKYKISISSE
jgi:prophage DNA circulation protein